MMIPTSKRTPEIPLIQMAKMHPPGNLPFVVQPLLQPRNNELFAFEALYRGVRPVDANWTSIDEGLLLWLAEFKVTAPLFINLSNDTILSVDEDVLLAANRNNNLYFEWSEVVADEAEFIKIVAKINRWAAKGLRFAIDDFGAGRDGLERLFKINSVTALKFDGNFFRTAFSNTFARKIAEHIVEECAQKNILTVAECVETEEEYRFAQSLGVDLAQGYFIDDVYNAARPNCLALVA